MTGDQEQVEPRPRLARFALMRDRSDVQMNFWGLVLFLSQYLPGIGTATSLLVAGLLLHFVSVGKSKPALYLLLLFSSMVGDGVNIYTLKIGPIGLFNFVFLMMLLIKCLPTLRYDKSLEQFVPPLALFIAYSVLMNHQFLTFVVKDIYLCAFIPLAFVILFRDVLGREIFRLICNIIAVRLVASALMFLTGLSLTAGNGALAISSIDNADELSGLYHTLIFVFPLFLGFRKFRSIAFLLGGWFVGVAAFGIGFFGSGSQVMLMLAMILVWFAIQPKHIVRTLMFAGVVAIAGLYIELSSGLLFKVQNIVGLVQNLDVNLIDLIPYSPRIRVIEMINILSYSPWYLIFGHGFGGHFIDNWYRFPDLQSFDYSNFEILHRIYFNPHNMNFALLKFGMLWYGIIFLMFTKVRKIRDQTLRVFGYCLLFNLAMNLGYSIKSSFLLGIVIIILVQAHSVSEPPIEDQVF